MIGNVLDELGRAGEQRDLSTVTQRRGEPKRAEECGSWKTRRNARGSHGGLGGAEERACTGPCWRSPKPNRKEGERHRKEGCVGDL